MTLPEFFYYIGYSLDKHFKLKHQKHLPHKVISIGNITVGGTGKTPAAIAIAEEAKKRGFSPIILTRGYRGKAKGPCFVTTVSTKQYAVSSKKIEKNVPTAYCLLPTEKFGDEPVLMAERLKEVPIIKCADRFEGGLFALNSLRITHHASLVFILDDGFQHWKLYRDIDIVLIDGLNPFGNKKLLPMGPLREPLSELKKADIFVVTKTKNKALSDELRDINPEAPVYFSEYKINKIKDADSNEYQIEMLKDKKVFAFCGIANPKSFESTVLPLCKELSGFKAYRDHHRYTERDIFYLENQFKTLKCDFLITTEKDMVKIKELKVPDNLLYVEIGFGINKEFFEYLFETKRQLPPKR